MSEDQNQSRAEWERERAAELEARDKTALAVKAARLEWDLNAKTKRITDLETQLPPEGSVVLKGADKDRWEAYQTLGKPEDLKADREERDTLKAEKTDREHRDALTAAAAAAQFKPRVLERLAPQGAVFTTKDEQHDGQTVQVAYITVDGTTTPLTDWAATDPDFLPALTVTPEGKQEQRTTIPKQRTDGKKNEPVSLAREQNARAAPHLRKTT